MDRLRVILLLVVVAVIFIIGFFVFGKNQSIPFLTKQPTVTINNHTFSVEVAQSPAQQEKGLSNRSSLAGSHGMYFPFSSPSFYAFWMKDMKFPLDIIYIAQGKVVTVHANVKPAADPYTTVVKPTQAANAVLEINAGEAKKYAIKEGDAVKTSL